MDRYVLHDGKMRFQSFGPKNGTWCKWEDVEKIDRDLHLKTISKEHAVNDRRKAEGDLRAAKENITKLEILVESYKLDIERLNKRWDELRAVLESKAVHDSKFRPSDVLLEMEELEND